MAGPSANLIFGAVLRICLIGLDQIEGNQSLYSRAITTSDAWCFLIYLQGVACLLNLLPLPPLDGWAALQPHLRDDFFVKSFMARSSINQATVSLITFAIIYVLLMTVSATFSHIPDDSFSIQTTLMQYLTYVSTRVFLLSPVQTQKAFYYFFNSFHSLLKPH